MTAMTTASKAAAAQNGRDEQDGVDVDRRREWSGEIGICRLVVQLESRFRPQRGGSGEVGFESVAAVKEQMALH